MLKSPTMIIELFISLHSSVDFALYILKLCYLEHPNLLQHSRELDMLPLSLVMLFGLKAYFF